MDLLDLRPLETGQEGVRTGGDVVIRVTSPEHTNLDVVRRRALLGEMKRAVPRSMASNDSRMRTSTAFWPPAEEQSTGLVRPARCRRAARLGDFSGMEILRKSIANGDPLGTAGDFCRNGDYAEIGLKRFIPDVIPLLNHRDALRRISAAQTILRLIESGR